MSEIINKFNIFRDFPPNLRQNIKSFHVSRDSGYCVLNDNKVYGFGERIHKILGYNKSNEEKYVLINEFNDKNIIEFYCGYQYMLARNTKNEIFSWGRNEYGQLARGFTSELEEYWRPEKIDFFDGKNILEISCGVYHCLALSSDERVYGWGNNGFGEVGCADKIGKIISTPIQIQFKEKIQFIHCMRRMCFAVNYDGNSYYWGLIEQEIISHPVICKESVKIKSVINYLYNIYFLSFEGMIYEFNEKESNLKILCDLKEIEKQYKIIDLYVDSDKRVIFETQESLYIYHNSKVETISYKTLFEYFLYEFQITYKTIHIKENQLFVSDFKSEKNSENLIEKQKKIYSNENSFKQNFSLNKFRISKDLPQILESNVKFCYQSESYTNCYFGLFVMNDNRVYCLGYNGFGKLGLGHEERVYEFTEIIELREKNIQQFYEGFTCMFARSVNNEIFSWGMNHFGQLARGLISEFEEYFQPVKIDFFDGKNIIEISSGLLHSLALSSDGRVFGWADNQYGSVGCGEEQGKSISTPIEIEFKDKIKFIHCTSNYLSFAVSFEGNSYFWGQIKEVQIDYTVRLELIFTPKFIPMKNVFKIYYLDSRENVFIILDKKGKVFEFKPKNEEIIEIKSEVNFCDLYNQDNNYYLFQSEECVYELNGRKLFKTDFINFFDFYNQKSNYYKKTIEISKDGYLTEKQIQFNKKEKILVLIDKFIFDRKYQSNFEEIKVKGRGGFGTVYEAVKNSNKVHYAIKMIEIQSKRTNILEIKYELNLNEIKIMSELNNDFIVQYIDSWIEAQMFFGKIKRCLFIQIELCSHSLRDLIGIMNKTFEENFKTFYYFISCELFSELIECVNYLHSLNPPIIHRDLKPENILISDGINRRFLKLCDFGLAKFHDKSNHTRMAGTWNYMAPEVRDSNKYNTKSDIYSLALISTEIFNFKNDIKTIRNEDNLSKYLTIYSKPELKRKFNSLLKTLSKCLLNDYNLRPDSRFILNSINEWTIDSNIILNDENITEFLQILDKNEYLKNFFDIKLTKNSKQSKIEKQNSKQIFNNNFNTLMILFVLIFSFIIYLIFY